MDSMVEEMGVVTAHEVDKMMKRLQREKALRLKMVMEKALSLEVGEEIFQCYIASLPPLHELRDLLNDKSTGMTFSVWPVINGTMIRREA